MRRDSATKWAARLVIRRWNLLVVVVVVVVPLRRLLSTLARRKFDKTFHGSAHDVQTRCQILPCQHARWFTPISTIDSHRLLSNGRIY